MRAKKKLQRNLVRDFRRYKDQIAGILGDYSGTVEVPNRSGYVFARLANQEVKEVFNKKVPNLVDLPVWVGYADDPREPHILQVLDTRTGVERQKGEDPISQFLPLHHQTHEWFNPEGGQDVVFSDKRQFMPFRPTPAGGMFVHVYRNVGWLNGQFTYFSGSSIDLSPYVPETGAYLGLLYEDINATLAFSTGTGDFLKDGFSLTLADIPNPLPGTYPIAAVRMWGGQTGIVEARDRTDLIDLRFPFTYGFNHLYDAPHSYTGSGGLGVFVKADETGLEFVTAGAGGGGQSSAITLFMTEDVGYVTGTFNLDTVVGNKENVVINNLNVSGTYAGSWISQEGALSFVNSGQYFIHFHAFREEGVDFGCGLYDARIGIRVNKRNSNGSHTLLQTLYQERTSPNPPYVTAYYTSPFGETGYTLTGTFASALSFADDEGILLEFFVDPVQTDSCTGAGCGGECDDPKVTMYFEGNTESGITLPVTTSGGPGHVIQDEGTDLAQQNRLNFVGGGVEAVNDPANGRTTIRIPGTVSVFDDGVFQVSGTALDFMDNLDVAVTGTHVFITGQAGGGGETGTFIGLTDTPENYFGAGEFFVKVKSDETGLEFVTGTASIFPSDPYTTSVATNRIASVKLGAPIDSIAVSGTDYQVIAYWNSDLYLVIGKRVIDGNWTFFTYDGSGGFPTIQLGTLDSHNFIAIALDSTGIIHVAYDMHNDALLYRKSDAAVNAWTGGLTATLSMLGTNESSVSYPTFFRDPSEGLYFMFRDGGSGNGDLFFYKYNTGTSSWAAATGTAAGGKLIDGKSTNVSPYWLYPVFDSDFGSGGYMHLSWFWRDTTDASTNHDMNYVRWNGTTFTKTTGAQTVPITDSNEETFDPVGTGNGLGDLLGRITSDSNGNPIIPYIKNSGDYQHIYVADHDGAAWTIQQITFTPSWQSNDPASLRQPQAFIDRSDDTAYIFYQDDRDIEGLLVQVSDPGDYTNWSRFVVYPRFIGNIALSFDAYQWWQDTEIYSAISYWKSGEDELPIRIFKWIPGNPDPQYGYDAGSGHEIQDEGTPLTQRNALNFVGAGVTVTDDSGNNASVVTIPGYGTSKTLQTHTILHQETLAGTGRFDVSGISQDYDHLIIRCQLRSTVANVIDNAHIYFNNDTTNANYHRQGAGGYDGATFAGEGDLPIILGVPGASSTADDFFNGEIQINNYTDAKRKQAYSLGGHRGDADTSWFGGSTVNWENTAAINRITLQPDGYATDSFAAGSYLEIIGVKEEAVGGAAYSTGTFSDPPTDAELDAEFGTPAQVGSGFLAALNNGYFVWAYNTNWFYVTGTIAM